MYIHFLLQISNEKRPVEYSGILLYLDNDKWDTIPVDQTLRTDKN